MTTTTAAAGAEGAYCISSITAGRGDISLHLLLSITGAVASACTYSSLPLALRLTSLRLLLLLSIAGGASACTHFSSSLALRGNCLRLCSHSSLQAPSDNCPRLLYLCYAVLLRCSASTAPSAHTHRRCALGRQLCDHVCLRLFFYA
jgi:hypothetical protein